VELDPDRRSPPSARFLPVDVLRWHAVEVALSGVAALESVPAEVLAQVAVALAGVEGVEAHAVRVTLTGATDLHHALATPEALATLEDALAEAAGAQGWILESVQLATRQGWEVAEVLASGGLPGELARLIAHPPGSAELASLCRDAGLPALDARLARLGLPGLDRVGLLPAAATLALDLMLEEP
jgi:hypothetical protein